MEVFDGIVENSKIIMYIFTYFMFKSVGSLRFFLYFYSATMH